ncbi:MAG: hypothetical protein HS104_29935 [Polyangiaceae bacterium]|nr:hypothetical protein [Polyangiaceae bacterium]MCE7888463.1 hypothetical protein [Sorangiineae bacterium PRO1]MCL4754657.1 hypothetical protein [Myxococcales bacterium]
MFKSVAVALGVGLSCLVVACGKPQLDKVPEEQVDAAKKANAEALGTKILSAWAKDEYPLLGDEAAEAFRKAHNADDAQRAADKSIEKELGSFQAMTYHETLRTKDGKTDVFRFKGTFDKSKVASEVRVVIDAQGKLTGFWVKPWKDQL